MSKFIEITTEGGVNLLINTDHIVAIKPFKNSGTAKSIIYLDELTGDSKIIRSSDEFDDIKLKCSC